MDRHLKFLEWMKNHEIGESVDVSVFIRDNFVAPSTELIPTWKQEANEAVYFLKNMNHMGYIEAIDDFSFAARVEVDGTMHWFNKPFQAVFKAEGYNYLQQHYLQQSVFLLNGATVKNYKRQFLMTTVIAAATIVSAVNGYFSYKTATQNNANIIKDSINKGINDSLKKMAIPLKQKSLPSTLKK